MNKLKKTFRFHDNPETRDLLKAAMLVIKELAIYYNFPKEFKERYPQQAKTPWKRLGEILKILELEPRYLEDIEENIQSWERDALYEEYEE
jgi:hypothetical protein